MPGSSYERTPKDGTSSTAFWPALTPGHRPGADRDIPFRSTNGAAAPGEVWTVERQTGPRRAAPMVLLYAVFATHPQRGEYSRPPLAPAVIAPQYRCPRGEDWRIPQSSPASPWEGVSKFHYPPRCRRARPATAGSKVRVDRSVRSLFTSSELPSWRRAFCRYSHGFCAWNTVYSVVGGRLVPPHLSGEFLAVCCVYQRENFKIFCKFFRPKSIERVIWLLFTPSALAIAVTLRPRMKRA